MRHSILNENFGEKEMSLPCRVQFNLAQLSQHGCVVSLDIDRARFDASVDDVAVV